MTNKNKPVRMSKQVKEELMKIKQEQELKSMDAVLKKLLRWRSFRESTPRTQEDKLKRALARRKI